jgi:hypothetical protein
VVLAKASRRAVRLGATENWLELRLICGGAGLLRLMSAIC